MAQYERFQDLKMEGNEKFKLKDYKGAIAKYTEAIETFGNEPVAFTNRALCYINLKKYYEAKDDCDKAILLDSKSTKAYYRRALANKELLLFQQAKRDFKKVLELDSTSLAAKKEIDVIESILAEDQRVNLASIEELLDKPQKFRSMKDLKSFQLHGQYQGIKSYF